MPWVNYEVDDAESTPKLLQVQRYLFGLKDMNEQKTLRSRILEGVAWALVLLGFLLVLFRMVSLILLLLVLAFGLFTRKDRRPLVFKVGLALFFLSLLSPADVALGPYPGRLRGDCGKGLRFVRLVYGMPMHFSLVERYGEYFTGGCCAPPFPPRWILTWKAGNEAEQGAEPDASGRGAG